MRQAVVHEVHAPALLGPRGRRQWLPRPGDAFAPSALHVQALRSPGSDWKYVCTSRPNGVVNRSTTCVCVRSSGSFANSDVLRDTGAS